MLSTVSLYMHGHLGIEARQDILYHRGETMKIIHERLANIDNVDKGLLMSTIVTILSFEVQPLSESQALMTKDTPRISVEITTPQKRTWEPFVASSQHREVWNNTAKTTVSHEL
jgi:hypothetical protein